MKGDFTRDTFDPKNQFTRVHMQQGRVQLDSDWNEQSAILLHYLRSLAADLIGPYGGPTGNVGFEISVPDGTVNGDFAIGKGVYYVGGMRCENPALNSYANQPDYPLTDADKLTDQNSPYVVYLDTWERHVTYNEHDTIREVALGGPDTTTRSRLVCQVRTLLLEDRATDPTDVTWIESHKPPYSAEEKRALIEMGLPLLRLAFKKNPDAKIQASITKVEATLAALNGARLRARAFVNQPSTDPCNISPEARYRRAENQHYRVEVHRSGPAWNKLTATVHDAATFKWSRENGSVVFPIRTLDGRVATLAHLGRDDRFGLREGDYVEVVDNDYVLQNRAEELLFVESIQRDTLQVTLNRAPESTVGQDTNKNPLLRRWDHNGRELKLDSGAALILEGDGEENWLKLEDGVQVQFKKPAAGTDNQYRTGDYWLIPARTATGDVEWPGPADNPDALPPRGVEHHYAPLHRITVAGGKVTADPQKTLRFQFDPQSIPLFKV